jgi:hypothetical protein
MGPAGDLYQDWLYWREPVEICWAGLEKHEWNLSNRHLFQGDAYNVTY